MKQKIGIAIYNEEQPDAYFKAFKSYYQNSDYDFTISWTSIDEMISTLRDQGSIAMNELERILVFDQAFNDQDNVTGMVNSFVTLEEVMRNKNVTKPILSLVTTNQELYDMFKKETSPEGHDLFYYPKTRVYRLNLSREGQINLGQINQILAGDLDDTALSLKNDYEGRETVARNEIEKFKKEKLNQKVGKINELANKIKADQERLAQEKELKEQQSEETSQNPSPLSQSPEQKINNRLHVAESIEQEKESDNVNVTELQDLSNKLRMNPINYQGKLMQDHGTILIGGLSGSGESSFIFNLAHLYAMMGKKVLILNLNDNDHLIRYMEQQFIPRYQELGRKNVLTTKYVKSLSEIVVPINNLIHVVSDYGFYQKIYTLQERLLQYERILNNAIQEYQVILINSGDLFEKILQNTNLELINDCIVVTTQDMIQDLSIDLISNLQKFLIKSRYLSNPIGLVINQIKYYQSNHSIEEEILKLPVPFDRLRLLGTIPEKDDWSFQTKSYVPEIVVDDSIKMSMESIADKIII